MVYITKLRYHKNSNANKIQIQMENELSNFVDPTMSLSTDTMDCHAL